MAASYPTQPANFIAKVDVQDTVYADHINTLQNEVYAIETIVGSNPNVSNYTGSFSLTNTWTSLTDRITNIERGLVNGVGGTSPYFVKTGDSITSSVGQVGITVRPVTNNTSDLIQTQATDGTVGFKVDYTGKPKVGTYNVLYVNSTDYASLLAAIANANAAAAAAATAAAANPFNPFLLGGL
jgi:hypothetical protein